jgi:hypothetical protein
MFHDSQNLKIFIINNFMDKIYIDEIPNSQAVDTYIMSKTGSRDKWYMIKDSFNKTKLEFKINNYDHDLLKKDSFFCLENFGFHGWIHNTDSRKPIKYGGLSFVYNPNHIDNNDPMSSTLGTNRNKINQFYDYNTKNTPELKNSYLDTYSFIQPTELRNYGYIKTFLDSKTKRTLIRSRLGVIKAGFPSTKFNEYSWHRDEQIYINLRINIPITTEENYKFQMKDEEPYHLKIGHAYSWDTSIPHRVYHNTITNLDRIHFVLGYSPWFDYDHENRCWIKNDFWGKHPFQMLVDGDIFSDLELINNGI